MVLAGAVLSLFLSVAFFITCLRKSGILVQKKGAEADAMDLDDGDSVWHWLFSYECRRNG